MPPRRATGRRRETPKPLEETSMPDKVYPSTYVPRTCEWCGRPFPARASNVAMGRGRFCSHTCGHLGRRKRPLAERFWGKVSKDGPLPAFMPELGCCWPWIASLDKAGYGQIHTGGRANAAHQVALELALGRPLAEGEWACHTCDYPACVRNDEIGTYVVNGVAYPRFGHLWVGDQSSNIADMAAKGRTAQGTKNGHSKLTEGDVSDIVALLQQGVPSHAVAIRYGVSWPTINHIQYGRSWRHVTGL